jgi:hypothetical protein
MFSPSSWAVLTTYFKSLLLCLRHNSCYWKMFRSDTTLWTISDIFLYLDNQLHSIIQWYMTYIKENNSLHALLLKTITDSNLYLPPPSQNHTCGQSLWRCSILQNPPDSFKNITSTHTFLTKYKFVLKMRIHISFWN